MNLLPAIYTVASSVWNLVARPRPSSRIIWPGTSGGVYVSQDVALQLAAVWRCVHILAETISTLGWHIIDEAPDGSRKRETGGALPWLLNVQANPEMTAFTWRELVMNHVLLWGNHYSEIQRDRSGRPIWIWPLDPQAVSLDRNETGQLIYKVYGASPAIISPNDMIHVKGMGYDGLIGYSVIRFAAQSMGMSYSMEQFGSAFFHNGAHLGLILEHPGTLSPASRDNLLKSLDEKYRGGRNAFKALIAEEGMKLNKASMPLVDAQFLESRQNQVPEICRWFGVPPHKVGDLSRATFSNIEHQAIEFVQDSILPWCRRLEQEVDLKLIGFRRQGNVYTRLNIDTLLRGDFASRMVGYTAGRNGGWYSPNDIRRLEGMDPLGPEGDIYLQPLNMVPLGTKPPEPKPLPVPTKEEVAKEVVDMLAPQLYHVKDIVTTAIAIRAPQALQPTQFSIEAGAIQMHGAPITVSVPERAITVNPPDIKVGVPIVNVAPPVVNVEVKGGKTKTTPQRNEQGLIEHSITEPVE
jgi:HK97 family phage portal protein